MGDPRREIEKNVVERKNTRREYVTAVILCVGNLINFMDRYTTAGTLADIQCHFNIDDSEGGLIQTLFITTYTVCAPLFGYLGDRYSRRFILTGGIILWSAAGMASSFMGPNDFTWFLVLRCILGAFEATFTTIAPTIISDLFVGNQRSKLLAMFYFAIPVGSGLGYVVGSLPLQFGADWEWGLRITPFLGWIEAILLAFVIIDPPRGIAEGNKMEATSYMMDLKDLAKNGSFILVTLAAAAVAFFAGAVAWWGPKFIALGALVQTGDTDLSIGLSSLLFGVITMICGLVAVPGGAWLGRWLKPRFIASESLVGGVGLLVAGPFFFMVIYFASINTDVVWVMLTIGELLVNLNWSLTVDICMSVVVPTRRATATAINIFLSHALGDCGSPYFVGLISEALKPILNESTKAVGPITVLTRTVSDDQCAGSTLDPADFRPLQYAMYINVIVTAFAGAFFLYITFFFEKDKKKADAQVAKAQFTYKDDSSVGREGETPLDQVQEKHV